MNSLKATLIGLLAIALWALLALFTAASGKVPPFQLTAMCFSVATLIGVVQILRSGSGTTIFRQPILVWILGVGGLFGYHFFYFTALRNAPPVEAGLIAYLWPLLIIFFSALLPDEKLKLHHIIGGLVGCAGAYLVVSKGQAINFDPRHSLGFMAAGLCALIWSGYSVSMRFFPQVPSETVTGFCAISAILALICHIATEETVWPAGQIQWLATLALALGPVGLAFYVWDYGVKHGNIQVLGAVSYLAPVLSTIALVAAGFAEASISLAIATILVTLGAVIAAKDMIFSKKSAPGD